MSTFQERIDFLSTISASILAKLEELNDLRKQVRQAQTAASNQSYVGRVRPGKCRQRVGPTQSALLVARSNLRPRDRFASSPRKCPGDRKGATAAITLRLSSAFDCGHSEPGAMLARVPSSAQWPGTGRCRISPRAAADSPGKDGWQNQ